MKFLVIVFALLVANSGWASAQTSPKDGFNGKRFGNWLGSCRTTPNGEVTRCAIQQALDATRDDKSRRILTISAGYFGKDGVAALVIEVPLGGFLPAGIVLTIPGAEPIKMAYETCRVSGCRGATVLTDPMLAAMAKAESATVTVLNIRRQQVQLPFSLKGFAVGFGSLPQIKN